MPKLQINSLIILFVCLFSSINFAQNANDLIPKNEPFYIQSANDWGHRNTGYWDLPGRGKKIIRVGAPIKVYALSDHDTDRKYVIKNSRTRGYVKIHIAGYAAYVDVKGGRNKNGTKLQIYKPNNTSAQNFKFVYQGNGRFKIFNQNGKLITLQGRSSKNRSKLQIWDNHNGSWTEWYLISARTNKTLNLDNKFSKKGTNMSGIHSVYIQSAINYGKDFYGFFDVPGYNYPKRGNNIQMYQLSDFHPDRAFNINNSTSSFDYYSISIAGNDNLVLDVSGNHSANGTNIGIWTRNNSSAQNYYFKYQGNGKFKIYNQNGKIITLANRSSKNRSNVQIWDDHEGPWTEWYLIDTKTGKPFAPTNVRMTPTSASIRSSNVNSSSGTGNLVSTIDNTNNKLNSMIRKVTKVFSRVRNAYSTMDRAYETSDRFNNLNSKVDHTYNALAAFTHIPFIGKAVKAITMSLDMAKSKLEKANTGIESIRKPVIDPAHDNIKYALTTMITFQSRLNKLQYTLQSLKKSIAQNSGAAQQKSGIINSKLSEVNNSLASVDRELNQIDRTSNSVNKTGGPIRTVDSGIKRFEKAFNKTDKASGHINKVLDKRFRKKITIGKWKLKKTFKISISLRDVLTGGKKIRGIFKKYVDKWVQKAIRPLLSKLHIRIPTVPGVNRFKSSLQNSLNLTKKIRESSRNLDNVGRQISSQYPALSI